MPETADDRLTSTDIAGMVGVKVETVQVYLHNARKHRAAGEPLPGDLPEPDGYQLNRPWWLRSTVDAWRAARPSATWVRRGRRRRT